MFTQFKSFYKGLTWKPAVRKTVEKVVEKVTEDLTYKPSESGKALNEIVVNSIPNNPTKIVMVVGSVLVASTLYTGVVSTATTVCVLSLTAIASAGLVGCTVVSMNDIDSD